MAPALVLVATSTGSVAIHHWAVPALLLLPPTSPRLWVTLHPWHPWCTPLRLNLASNPPINNEKPGLALACLNAPMLVNEDWSVELGKFNLL